MSNEKRQCRKRLKLDYQIVKKFQGASFWRSWSHVIPSGSKGVSDSCIETSRNLLTEFTIAEI